MDNKQKCIAIIALMLALVAIFLSSEPGTNGINGTNAVLGTLTFALHNTSSDVTAYNSLTMNSVIVADVPKTYRFINSTTNGDTIISNFTSPAMNLTLIPAGAISVHIHALKVDGVSHDDTLWFEIGTVNSTGGNFSNAGISTTTIQKITTTETEFDISGVMIEKVINSTDRLKLTIYNHQTGTGGLPDITIYMDDLTISRLVIPAIPIDLTSLINQVSTNKANIDIKVNKSGDNMTGNLTFVNFNGIVSPVFGGVVSGIIVAPLRSYMFTDGKYIETTLAGVVTNTDINLTGHTLLDSGNITLPVLNATTGIILSSPSVNITFNLTTGDTSATDSNDQNFIWYSKFTSNITTTITKLYWNINSSGGGNGKMAIYSDNGGNPNTLLTQTSGQPLVNGWNLFTISSTNIVNGTSYWIGAHTDTSATVIYQKINGLGENQALSYASSFPSTATGASGKSTWNNAAYVDDVSGITYFCVRVNSVGTLYTTPGNC